ncbi:hypothetical protein LSAT2_015973 [Lamellibrachia satsuma]|nr:hypothetical protein LSAT2_015973 [Lamellibrachia satsuma]
MEAVFSRRKYNDGVRNKLRTMVTAEEELQKKKELLLLKKKSLSKERHVELQSTRSKLSTIQQKMFNQIVPLMTIVHHLQLQVTELGEKMKQSEIRKEKNSIMHALSTVCDQSNGGTVDMLREWYKQMMYHSASHGNTNAPIELDVRDLDILHFNVSNSPETRIESSQRSLCARRTLSFCTAHKGVSLKVDITATSLLSSLPVELETRSSLYLDGLSEEVQICAAEQRDSSYLVSSVIWRLLDQQIVKNVSPDDL